MRNLVYNALLKVQECLYVIHGSVSSQRPDLMKIVEGSKSVKIWKNELKPAKRVWGNLRRLMLSIFKSDHEELVKCAF